jgi:hypothetical protein
MLTSSEQNDSTSVTGVSDLVKRVEQEGFAVVPACLNEEVCCSDGNSGDSNTTLSK